MIDVLFHVFSIAGLAYLSSERIGGQLGNMGDIHQQITALIVVVGEFPVQTDEVSLVVMDGIGTGTVPPLGTIIDEVMLVDVVGGEVSNGLGIHGLVP
jgi:hypothetical protein